MAAIVWADVTAGASTLATLDATEQALILAYVNERFAPGIGTEASAAVKTARIYLARHMGTSGINGGAGGAVTSESEGGLSRSYAVVASGDAGTWGQTVWGQLLNSVLRTSPARAGILL